MPITLSTLIEERTTRDVFERAITAWTRRDLEALLLDIDDDIANNINVDAAVVAFAPSVRGKQAYRDKLAHILSTFDFAAYVTRHLEVTRNTARANMMIVWVHKRTGERLNTNFRFVVEQTAGRITRIDQFYDAAYVESYSRLISPPAAPQPGSGRAGGLGGFPETGALMRAPLPARPGPRAPWPPPSRRS